jgi:hypothetical protein
MRATRSTPPPNLHANREVRARRVSVISFSHGAAIVLAWLVLRTSEPAFTVAIAYYPDCDTRDLSSTPVGAGRWRAATA